MEPGRAFKNTWLVRKYLVESYCRYDNSFFEARLGFHILTCFLVFKAISKTWGISFNDLIYASDMLSDFSLRAAVEKFPDRLDLVSMQL